MLIDLSSLKVIFLICSQVFISFKEIGAISLVEITTFSILLLIIVTFKNDDTNSKFSSM